MGNVTISMLLIILGVFIYTKTTSADFSGKVTMVIDGDTVIISGKRVRLSGIDAPETRQQFGDVSTKALKSLINGRHVKVKTSKKDRYKRYLGTIYLRGADVNLLMVKKGNAWVYRRYNKNPKYLSAEKRAKRKIIGLWKEKNATPPWVWRYNNRGNR